MSIVAVVVAVVVVVVVAVVVVVTPSRAHYFGRGHLDTASRPIDVVVDELLNNANLQNERPLPVRIGNGVQGRRPYPETVSGDRIRRPETVSGDRIR